MSTETDPAPVEWIRRVLFVLLLTVPYAVIAAVAFAIDGTDGVRATVSMYRDVVAGRYP